MRRQNISGDLLIQVTIVSFVILLVIFVDLTAFRSSRAFGSEDVKTEEKTIIIDAGHGGEDGGAIGYDGVIEKDINLSISLKLKTFFRLAGYQVIMTRDSDKAIYDSGSNTIRQKKTSDLHNRLKLASSYPDALFLSIHQNIYESSRYSGAQVFYSQNNPQSKTLAEIIQKQIREQLQPTNNRMIKKAEKNLFLLYYAKSPSVMVECGFLSNPTECKNLENNSYQQKIAFSIFSAVLSYGSGT
ncbi:MAG TPA: N-acetylmuramoyl-L-alanine amidase CwlD [Clostridia bacterium]|nr:N-acetylmuramoyl-L-alanine amidase CwlD [Clostridia bacterium]